MKQFVVVIYGIILVGGKYGFSKGEWGSFKDNIDDFRILKWNVEDPSLSFSFLHLTLTTEDGNIVSKTYQKPLNLYQYTCPNPAQPPWMLKGIVFSMLNRYYYQNRHLKDLWEIAMLLFKRLKDQG